MAGKKSAIIIITEGTEETELVAPVDLMRRAEIDVTIAGVDGTDNVKCSRGIRIIPDDSLTEAMKKDYDIVIIPGGPAYKKLAQSSLIKDLLKKQEDRNGIIAAICAGPIVLKTNRIGLNKTVTSHPSVKDEIIADGSYKYSEENVVVDESLSTDGRPTLCDINFVNLNFVSDVQVIKEITAGPPTPHSLNTDRLTNRLKNNVNNKRRLITAMQSGVSPEGQKLYLTITKTIEDVKWEGPDIIVLDQVKITPPYKPENVIGNADNKAYNHLRKIVEKYTKDLQSVKKDMQTTNNSNICGVSSTSSNNSNLNNCATPLSQ
ncbi:hypothetical protein PGB90_000984 [Kerria lacca]